MNKSIIVWDIENVHFRTMKKFFHKTKLNPIQKEIKQIIYFNNIDKHFVRNTKHLPLKESEERFLINQNWILHEVKPGLNSADHKIKEILESNINKYKQFILISNDYGFANIISNISKKHKIILICELERSNKLMNSCFSNEELNIENFSFLHI